MIKILRYKITELNKKISLTNLQKKQKEENLKVEYPQTTFNQRYYANKLEPIIAQKLQQNFSDLLQKIRQKQNTQIITNQSSLPLENGIDVNDIISKIYCDINHKYQLICGQNVDINWNLNILSKEFFNQLDDFNNLDQKLKQRLQVYLSQMIRWGFPVSSNNFTLDIDYNYIENLYQTFFQLFQKKIIKKGVEKKYWSIKDQKFLSSSQYNLTYKNIDLKFVSYEVADFGNEKVISQIFKNDKLYVLVTLTELEQIPLANAVKVNPDQNYLIIYFYGHYYLAEENFCRRKIIRKYSDFKVIESLKGSVLIGWSLKNHFRDNFLQFIEQDNLKLYESRINLNCPNYSNEDFILSQENKIDIFDNIDEQGFIIEGELAGYKYNETKKIIQKKIDQYIEDFQMCVREIQEAKKEVTEERLLLYNQDYFYLEINEKQKAQIFENIKKINFFGQEQDQNEEVQDLEYYLQKNKFRISEDSQIGIPIPLIKNSKRRQRQNYKEVGKELLEKLKQLPIPDWNNIKISDVTQDAQNDNRLDSQTFSIEFLKAFNLFYNLKKKNNDRNKLLESLQKEEFIEFTRKLPYFSTSFSVLENENYLPLCLVMAEILESAIPFQSIKRHGILVDDLSLRLKQSVDIIINGINDDNQEKSYSYGTDAFRFYVSSIDVEQNQYTNIKLLDSLAQNKKAEINVIRQIYKRAFQLINKNFEQNLESLETKCETGELQTIDQITLNAFLITQKICKQAYDQQNYNKVYSTFLDFFVNIFMNIYIETVQNDILCKRENSQNSKQILAYIVQESLKMISPILTFNAENIYQEIQWINKKNCIFEEQLHPLNIEINENLFDQAQQLFVFKEKMKKLFIILKQKKIIQKTQELKIYFELSFDQERRSYHKKLNIIKAYLEALPFEHIFQVSDVQLIEVTDVQEELEEFEEKTGFIKIYIDGEMIPLNVLYQVQVEEQQCQRCELYKLQEGQSFCFDCHAETQGLLEDLSSNQKFIQQIN